MTARQMEALRDATFDLSWNHDLSDEEEAESYVEMLEVLSTYANQWDQLVKIIQMNLVQDGLSRDCLFRNLANLAQDKKMPGIGELAGLLTELMRIRPNTTYLLDEIAVIGEFIIAPALERQEYVLCTSLLHVIYDVVHTEERLRRCEWYKWMDDLSGDMIYDLYSATKDKITGEIVSWYDEMFFVDLTELDEALLRQVEEERRG